MTLLTFIFITECFLVTKEDESKKTFLEVLDNFTSLLEKVQGI